MVVTLVTKSSQNGFFVPVCSKPIDFHLMVIFAFWDLLYDLQ